MKEYEVSRELVDSIQARQLELSGLDHMLGFCLTTNEYVIPEDKIAKIQHDIIIKNAEYENLKERVKDFILDEDLKSHSWNLDFVSGKVTVNE